MSISQFRLIPNNIQLTAGGNPGGTNSATLVMCGLAISFTPKYTGKVKILVSCRGNNSLVGDFIAAQISYGTGTAPNNGDAVTGTQTGVIVAIPAPVNNINFAMPTIIALPTLTPGTTYWFDLAQEIVTGGTGALSAISYLIEEIVA